MKKKLAFLMILIAFLGIIGFTLKNYLSPNVNQAEIISPVPNFLNLSDNKQVKGISIWLPTLTDFLFGNESKAPQITAKSALVFDITTSKTIFEKNTALRLPMASLTKIMTAIIALENPKTNDKYQVKKEDLVGEDSMGLSQGEVLSLNELLYGLVLTSGNDAAETIASNFPGGRTAFIKAMNDKVKSLGLKDTNYTNPSGLEGDGDQYTTAYDLLVITQYALNNFPQFRKVVSTFDYTIPQTETHKMFAMENETNLISSYPGVKGVKDGYTPEAGLCLVTFLDYDNHKIIAVLLDSENRRQEMKDLLDYSLKSEGVNPPPHD